MNEHTDDEIIAATRSWIERAVIGLGLCPFAKAVYTKNQIHYAVSTARSVPGLLEDLARELRSLAERRPEVTDTSLLIHPYVLADFLDFNDFLELTQVLLDELELTGIFQIASFHPQYQFEGTCVDDITNCTNRSPYPTLHLLREESVARALEALPHAEEIFEKNIETMRGLGSDGWKALAHPTGDDPG